jgi:hypothetical protein
MQGLAESAARSRVPVLLVTMLHTAFAEYLGAAADDSRRAEWQKVQGRFTDVAFQEPPEQLLRLVGSILGLVFAIFGIFAIGRAFFVSLDPVRPASTTAISSG